MFENIGHGLESSRTAGGEQQSKQTQIIGELQLNRMQSRAAAEADASGEQQLKRMQMGSSS